MDWLTELSYANRERLVEEVCWYHLQQIRLLQKIVQIESNSSELQSQNRTLQTQARQAQEYKAAYVIASSALEGYRSKHSCLLRVLKNPASIDVLNCISQTYRLPLTEFGSDINRLEVAVELTKLDQFKLEGGLFVVTETGKKMLRELGYETNLPESPALPD